MGDEVLTQPKIEPLLVITVETKLVRSVTGTPLGDRRVFDVVGGSFDGGLRGRVLASGGDWLIQTERGSQLDVRLMLETEDNVVLLFRYFGRASRRAGQAHIEVTGSFDAPDGTYGWLNDVQAFGLGAAVREGVRYQLFRFT
jgi:Protein of unknown function (DUF3237)